MVLYIRCHLGYESLEQVNMKTYQCFASNDEHAKHQLTTILRWATTNFVLKRCYSSDSTLPKTGRKCYDYEGTWNCVATYMGVADRLESIYYILPEDLQRISAWVQHCNSISHGSILQPIIVALRTRDAILIHKHVVCKLTMECPHSFRSKLRLSIP